MIPPIAVILSWPVVVYLFCRGRGPEITLIFATLGGYLFLPERVTINLPALYELNKTSIPAYTAILACLVAVAANRTTGGSSRSPSRVSASWLDGWLPRARFPLLLIVAMILGVVMTILTNRDPVLGPGVFIPGQRLYDAGASILFLVITITPMLLARKFLAHPEGQRLLLFGIFLAGMAYMPLVLFEVRMSPQLNQWLYGFFAHSWIQHVRGDGFRPIVFLAHGLRVSIFLTGAVLVTVGLARISEGKTRMGFLVAAAFLLVTLALTKSLGALMIALVFCPIMLFAPRRFLILAAAGTAMVVLLYPILRGTALLPLEEIQNFAASVNEKRAQSFGTRLYFEEVLLNRAQERPLFGWGGWGRNLYIGEEQAIPDGQWIIILGRYGWVGFLAIFGLLVFPVILLFWRWQKDGIGMESAVIAAALAASVVDLIPNSGLTPDKWLLAGALWGRLELGRVSERAPADPPPVRLRYKRAAKPAATTPPLNRYTRQAQRKERQVPR